MFPPFAGCILKVCSQILSPTGDIVFRCSAPWFTWMAAAARAQVTIFFTLFLKKSHSFFHRGIVPRRRLSTNAFWIGVRVNDASFVIANKGEESYQYGNKRETFSSPCHRQEDSSFSFSEFLNHSWSTSSFILVSIKRFPIYFSPASMKRNATRGLDCRFA